MIGKTYCGFAAKLAGAAMMTVNGHLKLRTHWHYSMFRKR